MTIDAVATRPGLGQRQLQRTVAWGTVIPLAAVMAYANGFWMTSLSGAVGAIERTRSPFTDWWHQATLALPIYIFGVLVALTLAQRWFGSVLRRQRAVAATALLVIAAGTVIGVALIAASSAYDYHLQANQLRVMDSMHSICAGNCLAQAQHATLAVHIHAVIYVGRLILLSDLVLIAWMVAMFGGRLNVSTPRRQPTSASRADATRLVLAAALLASAAIHAAVVPEHLAEWTAAGAFFIVLTAVQVAVAVLLLIRRARVVLLAAAAISAGALVLWLYSRTAGLPFGPDPGTPEPLGLADIASSTLELLALVVAVTLLRPRTWLTMRPAATHAKALMLVAVAAVTAIGLAATTTTWTPAAVSNSEMHAH